MPYALDYSAGRPTAAQVLAAGYTGVIRYIGFPANRKCITPGEYADMTAAGVGVALVFEQFAGDMLGGRASGARAATLARTHANAVGFPRGRPIYYACDTDVVAAAEFAAVLDYLRGAATVDGGVQLVGVYGEYDVMERAAAVGVASWFWQTRAWSAGRLSARAHIRQEIGTYTVGGIACDRNTILAADWGQTGQTGDDHMSAADVAELKAYLTSDVVKAMVRAELITALSDPTHQYLQDELGPLKQALTLLGGQVAALAAKLAALGDDEAQVLAAVARSQSAVQAAVADAVREIAGSGGNPGDPGFPAAVADAVMARFRADLQPGPAA